MFVADSSMKKIAPQLDESSVGFCCHFHLPSDCFDVYWTKDLDFLEQLKLMTEKQEAKEAKSDLKFLEQLKLTAERQEAKEAKSGF